MGEAENLSYDLTVAFLSLTARALKRPKENPLTFLSLTARTLTGFPEGYPR